MARQFSETEIQQMWDDVRSEFPGDTMMQEIHFIRLKHYYETKDLDPDGIVKFYNRERPDEPKSDV